jgi:anti-anti-sigma factor
MFSVTLSPDHAGPYIVVELRGELDIADVEAGAAMLTSTAAVNPQVIADLAALTFIDCRGLAMLCRVRNWLRAAGGDLALAAPSVRVRRVLTAAGLDRVFPVYGSAGEVPFSSRSISPEDLAAAMTNDLASLLRVRCQEMATRRVPPAAMKGSGRFTAGAPASFAGQGPRLTGVSAPGT